MSLTRRALLLFVALTPGWCADRDAPPWEKPVRAGRYLYLENCSVCHEINRQKSVKFGPNLFRLFQRGPLPLARGKPTSEYVAGKLKNGGFVMPSFRNVLNDEQIDRIVEYIRFTSAPRSEGDGRAQACQPRPVQRDRRR